MKWIWIAAIAVCSVGTAVALPAEQKAGALEFWNSGKVLPASLPFSEAVRVDRTIHLSGMIGVAPGTLKLVPGGIDAESRQVMANIRAVLAAHGHGLEHVAKCTVMLADMADWEAFNDVYKAFFKSPYPARSAFGAARLALGARIEVECIAALRN
ncbi:MAG: hypothetical protein RL685_2737 [Pseudomonadota bacterium]|jgi:reactive intermediate/imine deaminase